MAMRRSERRTGEYRERHAKGTARESRERAVNGINRVGQSVGDLRRDTRQLAFTTGLTPHPFAGDLEEDVEEHIEECERCICINAWPRKSIVKSLSFALESRSKYAFQMEVKYRLAKLKEKEKRRSSKGKGKRSAKCRQSAATLLWDENDNDSDSTSDDDFSSATDSSDYSDSSSK